MFSETGASNEITRRLEKEIREKGLDKMSYSELKKLKSEAKENVRSSDLKIVIFSFF